MKQLTIVAASVLLSACAVGPQYEQPQAAPIALASPQQTAFSRTAALPAPAAWWRFFDDARLVALVDAALLHNHDIRQAQANLLASRARFDERDLDRYPTVSGSAGYQRGSQQQPGPDGAARRTLAQSYRLGFDAQWELDVFGRLQRLAASEQARSDAAQAELQQLRLTIAADVARHYYERLGLLRKLDIAAAQVHSWRDTVAVIRAQVQLGTGLQEDLASAQATLLRSEAALPPLTAALQQASYRLDVLSGQRPGQPHPEMEAAAPAPLAKQLPLGDVNQLILARPDVRRAERLLAASTEDVGAATADLYPRFSLGGFVGFFALRGGDIGSASRAFDLAPNASWPAFPLASSRARLRGAEAHTQGALARYEQALLLAQEDVENAVTRLVQDQSRTASLIQSASHAASAIDIAGKRYQAGAGSYLALLENQRTLFQIRQEVADAETASYVNVIALYKALAWGATTSQ